MNTRIAQLKQQAMQDIAIKYNCSINDFTAPFDQKVMNEVDAQFAKLIIEDCIIQCEIVKTQCSYTNFGETARKTASTANSCIKLIKARFSE